MLPLLVRRIIHIAGDTLVVFYRVEMAVKRPNRSVSQGAGDEPYHEKAFEHVNILPNISGNV